MGGPRRPLLSSRCARGSIPRSSSRRAGPEATFKDAGRPLLSSRCAAPACASSPPQPSSSPSRASSPRPPQAPPLPSPLLHLVDPAARHCPCIEQKAAADGQGEGEAEEQGYRSRAEFKLLQVTVNHAPIGAFVVGVDLDISLPLPIHLRDAGNASNSSTSPPPPTQVLCRDVLADVLLQYYLQAKLVCRDVLSSREKYGPKGQNKLSNGAQGKPDKPKPNADVDINVGMSTRPPWFCRCMMQPISELYAANMILGHGRLETKIAMESGGAPDMVVIHLDVA